MNDFRKQEDMARSEIKLSLLPEVTTAVVFDFLHVVIEPYGSRAVNINNSFYSCKDSK